MRRSLNRGGKKRRDGNHADLVRKLNRVPGVSVVDTADLGGAGFDIVVGYRGVNYLLEIKNPDVPWKLEPSEERMSIEWPGQWAVVETFDEVLTLLGILPTI